MSYTLAALRTIYIVIKASLILPTVTRDNEVIVGTGATSEVAGIIRRINGFGVSPGIKESMIAICARTGTDRGIRDGDN